MEFDFTLQARHEPQDRHPAIAGLQAVHCSLVLHNPGLQGALVEFLDRNQSLHFPGFGSVHIEKARCSLQECTFTLVVQQNGNFDSSWYRIFRLNQSIKQAFATRLKDAVIAFNQHLQAHLRPYSKRAIKSTIDISITP